jgi:hypothetical protein
MRICLNLPLRLPNWVDVLMSAYSMSAYSVRNLLAMASVRDLPQAEHGEECFVDAPQLFGAEVPGKIAKSGGVHCTDLFHQNPGPIASDVDLGTEGSRSGRTRRGSNEHDRSRQELVGLNDDAESVSVLFVSGAPG